MAEDSSHDRAQTVDASVELRYEHAPCALFSTLPDGTIVQANQTFFEWIGLSAESVLGTTRFQQLLTIGSRMYYETHYAPLLHMQGVVNEIALEIRRADGIASPVVASARQVRDENGIVRFNRVALFDSSDRRKYEQELVLARKRAEQSAKELAETDRRRNEFIALLSHELRSPLAPIRSGLEILARSVLANDVAERATAMMQRQVAQLVRLVEDLLDVSRIGQDKLTLDLVATDLASVVRHAVEASDSTLRSAGLTITLTVPALPLFVNADAGRLTQVIENLLHNAAKFTPRDGSVLVVVEREQDDALIRVRDTGIGIEATELTRIFDLFAQTDRPTGRRGGLGIGLTLAKSLVERHGGRIEAFSAGAEAGTEFQIRLPVLTDAPTSMSD